MHTLSKYPDAATDCLPCIKGRRREKEADPIPQTEVDVHAENQQVFQDGTVECDHSSPIRREGKKGPVREREGEKPTSTRVPITTPHQATRFSSLKAHKNTHNSN